MAGRAIPSRLARTATVSSILFSLAAAAHLMPGGTLPVPMICLALFALITIPVMLLSRHRLSLPIMAALMGASQLALHAAFAALSTSSGFAPAGAGHIHGLHPATVHPMAAGMSSAPGPMAALHVAAAALATVMLAKGDAALWSLARWLRPLTSLPAPVDLPPLPATAADNPGFVAVLTPGVRLPALRGPPPAASAAL